MCTMRTTTRQTPIVMVLVLCFLCIHSEYILGEEHVDVEFRAGNQCVAKLELPPDYDRLKFPRNRSNGPLDMYLEMDIRQVREVDESKKSYTLDVVFYIRWRDERLIGQTEKINCNPIFPQHETPEFWIPDLKVESSQSYGKLTELLRGKANYIVDEKGWVMAWGATSCQLNCKSMDFSDYPYDKHKCEFLIRSEFYHQDFLRLHSTVLVGMASPSALPYNIYYTKLPKNKTLTIPNSATYSLAGFYVHLDRHIIPFWINIYIPISLLVTISWLSFIIPPEMMPGRMALLITILLMIINTSGSAHENTPSSDTFSLIDLWMLICIIFVSLAIFEYGLIIKIRSASPSFCVESGSTAHVQVVDGRRNWTRIIDRSSGFIFPIAFVIVNAIYGMVPTYSDESQGIDMENYLQNFEVL